MTTGAIIESGMRFGPYPAGQCFYIEKSACYRQVGQGVKISACYRQVGQGVKMAEFLLLRQQEQGPTLWVVEAKSSCPRDFTAYMDEIRVKLTNAFMLGVAACLGRHTAAKEELPEAFNSLALKTTSFRFVLVIKDVPCQHLVALQNALDAVLKPVIKTWAMSPTSVLVLNEIKAQKYGLILPAAGAAP